MKTGSSRDRQLHLVAVERNASGDPARYRDADLAHRDLNPTLTHRPVLFLELSTAGPTACPGPLRIRGVDVEGYHVLRAEGPVTPQVIAATALRLRDMCAAQPHIHFTWPEENRGPLHGIPLLSLTPGSTSCSHSRSATATSYEAHNYFTKGLISPRWPALTRSAVPTPSSLSSCSATRSPPWTRLEPAPSGSPGCPYAGALGAVDAA